MPPAIKRGGGTLALAALAPGVGSAGAGSWMWAAHAPIAACIMWSLATVATTVVAIVKIRSARSPQQVNAEAQAGRARQVKDPREAMLLMDLYALTANGKPDPAAMREIGKLLQQLADTSAGGSADLPPAVPPGGPAGPHGPISDEQLRKMVTEPPDPDAEALITTSC